MSAPILKRARQRPQATSRKADPLRVSARDNTRVGHTTTMERIGGVEFRCGAARLARPLGSVFRKVCLVFIVSSKSVEAGRFATPLALLVQLAKIIWQRSCPYGTISVGHITQSEDWY